MEYRIHPDQVSSTTERNAFLREVIAAFESVADVPTKHARDFNRRLSREYLALAMLEAEEGSRNHARAHAFKSLTLSLNPRNAFGALLTISAPRAIRPLRRLLMRRREQK